MWFNCLCQSVCLYVCQSICLRTRPLPPPPPPPPSLSLSLSLPHTYFSLLSSFIVSQGIITRRHRNLHDNLVTREHTILPLSVPLSLVVPLCLFVCLSVCLSRSFSTLPSHPTQSQGMFAGPILVTSLPGRLARLDVMTTSEIKRPTHTAVDRNKYWDLE